MLRPASIGPPPHGSLPRKSHPTATVVAPEPIRATVECVSVEFMCYTNREFRADAFDLKSYSCRRGVLVTNEPDSATGNFGPGDTIAGYRLEEQIGQGGMAVVYRAHDERLSRRVALKLLSPDLAPDTAFRARFIRESRATVAVDHPNIIPVYDAGEADGFLFIAMRYVPGGDVRSLLTDGEGLSPERVWKIISQVASALDAAHEHGLIHRDVKPANMLLENEHVYLSDFGISRLSVASRLTTAGQLVGTLDYIAPESIKGQPIDETVDQYSLACTAFELFAGRPPFHADLGLAVMHAHISAPPPSVTRKRPELPPAVDLIIARGMAKKAADRYASCGEFSADLGKALGQTPGSPVIGGAAGQPTAMPNAGQPRVQPDPRSRPVTELSAPAARPATEFAAPAAGSPTPQPQQVLIPRQTPPPQQIPSPQQLYAQGGWPTGNQWFPQQGYPPPPVQNWSAPHPSPPSRSQGTLVAIVTGTIAIVIAAIAAVAVVVNLSKNPSPTSGPTTVITRSTSPGPSPNPGSEASEAAAVNSLLQASVSTLQPLQGLTEDVGACGDVSYDYSRIRQIAGERASELVMARNLNVTSIPSGVTLKSDLIAAFQTSEEADEEYVTWADSEISACYPGFSSQYWQQAYRLDGTTTSEKKIFLQLWDPVASEFGFPLDPDF
jgi:serine/threonine protein kinase